MSTRRLILGIAAVAVVLGGLRLIRHVYYLDLINARSELESIKGIDSIHVYGCDDLTYEVAMATFALEGRPDAVVAIRGVCDPGHVWLARLGPWELRECTFGFNNVYNIASGKPVETLGFRDCIDIGPLGEYGAMLPVKVRDLNDLVAHYDELVRYFQTWPGGNPWGELKGRRGMRATYCRSPTGSGSVTPPSNFPGR